MIWIFEKILFKRNVSLLICVFISIISIIIELKFKIDNLFSSSGTFFTLAGLFLNIKSRNIFHFLRMPNGSKLNNESKYAIISRGSTFFNGNIEKSVIDKKVDEVEKDEIFGLIFILIGTLLWGYGSYFLNLYHMLYN